jgi:hypothetical protein
MPALTGKAPATIGAEGVRSWDVNSAEDLARASALETSPPEKANPHVAACAPRAEESPSATVTHGSRSKEEK